LNGVEAVEDVEVVVFGGLLVLLVVTDRLEKDQVLLTAGTNLIDLFETCKIDIFI